MLSYAGGLSSDIYLNFQAAVNMLLPSLFGVLLGLVTLDNVTAVPVGGKPSHVVRPYEKAPLQDLVTWDAHSIFVRGERIMLFSGEFHPFRIPVPGLWKDIFQKLRVAGFSAVSFYVDWVSLFSS